MKKTKKVWVILISFSCAFIFFVCEILGLLPYYPPERDCLLSSTILSIDSFPPGTRTNDYYEPDIASFDAISRDFFTESGIAINYTLIYRNSRQSTNEYNSEFNALLRNENYFVPKEINFKSQITDNFYYACKVDIYVGKRCEAIGQYEEYFILLSAHINEDGVNYDVFENLLEEMDWRMAQCLGVSIPKDTP